MTLENGWTLTYDAENMLTQATNGSSTYNYSYDPNGLRVKVTQGASGTVYIFSGAKVIAEYALGVQAANPSAEYVYANSTMVATLDGSGNILRYHHPDHLSIRRETDVNGNVVAANDPMPFGESSSASSKWKFTTYERDGTGIDFAMFRSYSSRIGRFMQPDRVSGETADGQSWNRYAYTNSDPINFADPMGLDQILAGRLVSCSIDGLAVGCKELGQWLPDGDPFSLLTQDVFFEIYGPCADGGCFVTRAHATLVNEDLIDLPSWFWNLDPLDPFDPLLEAIFAEDTSNCDKARFFGWLNTPEIWDMATRLDTTRTIIFTMAAKEGGWTEDALNHNIPLRETLIKFSRFHRHFS